VTILAVTGLAKEARIVGTTNVVAVAGGGDAEGLAGKLDALHGDISGVISIGLGGALSSLLKVGDVVIGERVLTETEKWDCDTEWRNCLVARLPAVHQGPLFGSDTVLAAMADKAALYEQTGALAVDMESHVAARFAASRKLPFAALRVISDAAAHSLPPAALVAMRPDGGISIGRILWSLVKRPIQIPALIRTGRDSSRAFKELLRCRDLCGAGLGGI
jgi:hopanoid-associated phosphorylase